MNNNMNNNNIMKKGAKGDKKSFYFPKNEKEVEINNIQEQNLLKIKPCHFVLLKEGKKFGVCYREECTFAHSLSELNIPKCIFGDNCKKIYATWNHELYRNDFDKKCEFKHPFETTEEYFKRTKIEIPDLPKTHEHTRKPKKQDVVKQEKKQDVEIENCWTKPLQIEKLEKQIEAGSDNQIKTEIKPTTECVKIMVPKDFVEKAIESAIKMGVLNFEVVII